MLNKKTRKENFKQVKIQLGEQIKQLRMERNMTLTELSEITGILISRLERVEDGQQLLNLGDLNFLAIYFDKKICVTLSD